MDAAGATELYVLNRGRAPMWLVPDSAGTPTVLNPQPFLLRTVYVQPSLEDLSRAQSQLATQWAWLLLPIPCPDGPPYRSALVFSLDRELSNMSWIDGPHIYHGDKMLLYRPSTRSGPWTWIGDVRNNQAGFFLTGPLGDDSLWRLFRAEIDAFDRWLLTLCPVRLSSRCPRADFSALKTPLLADEVAAQYADLSIAIANNAYREVVTKAKNIVEAIVAERIGSIGKGRDLFEDLRTIKRLLEDTAKQKSCGWTQLEYHLANKIRLVHGQTHATGPARSRHPLRPEFALSTVEDLTELLRIWGYCK